jgi:CelD/BcsL family acetyltransferase involved in cellulose biosynthesis
LRIVLLKEIPEDAELGRQWNCLALRTERPQVFYTYEWALAVYRAYGATLHPLLFLAYDEVGALCGVAALSTDADEKCASFLCSTTGDYCDFLSAPEKKDEFVAAIVGELKELGIKRTAFANLPADSGTLAAIRRAAPHHSSFCFARTAYVCAQVSLDRLEQGKDGKLVAPGLKRLRRLVKAMGPQAPVQVEHRRTWDSVEPVLAEFIQAHVARFLEIGRISNLAEARRQIFLAELAKVLSERQWFVLTRMTAGERAIAWHYGFQFQGSWFWYQPTFDSSVEKHWPGFCLLSHVIQDACDDPSMTVLDLGLGSEAYKAKFANESCETLYVTLHRSILEHWATIVRYRVASAVKSSARMEKFSGEIRKKLQGIRRRLRDSGAWSTAIWAGKRAARLVRERVEVVFFEGDDCEHVSARPQNLQLVPLTLGHLALAATAHNADDLTLEYLLRCAKRLRAGGAEGYVLAEVGRAVHFAWTAPMDGFFCSELNTALRASSDSVILFDCWTPPVIRKQGYYEHAIELISSRIRSRGKRPWVFSVVGNVASTRGIERAGFQRRYSLMRQRVLGRERIIGDPLTLPKAMPQMAAGSEDSAA